MNNIRLTGKLFRRVLSLILILAVMLSLAVPFTVVHAEETAARDDSIYAFIYKLDPNKPSTNVNMELVFQNNPNPDPSRIKLYGPYSDFAGTPYHTKTYKYDSNSNITIEEENRKNLPWNEHVWSIVKVTFENKIAPTYIASWFYNFQNLSEFENFENLDTSYCEDMAYAFYNIANYEGNLETLDLSGPNFVTSKVKQIDYFFSSRNIRTVNLTGMDLTGIGGNYPVKKGGNISEDEESVFFSDINTFISGCTKLENLIMDGVDLSKVIKLSYFLYNNAGLEYLDLSKTISPKSAYSCENMFRDNSGLKRVVLGSPENPFEIGTKFIQNYGDTYFSSTNNLETYGKKALIYMGNMFSGCSSLEEVDFANYSINQQLNLQYNNLFYNCSSLTEVRNLGNLFNDTVRFYDWGLKNAFNNCSSLTEIDLSGLTRSLGSGELIFAGCSSLKSLDLRNLGTKYNQKWEITPEQSSYVSLSANKNIYQGCDELSEVYFSPYYPIYSATSGRGSQGNAPPEKNWVKIEKPSDNQYNNENIAEGIRYRGEYSPVGGDPVTSSELFGNFQPKYAGRWVVVSKITLNANGGTPNQQSFEGARGMTLDYDPTKITEPKRNGYKFKGWYADRNDDTSQQLAPGEIAQSWSYYAHWEENTYNIILHSNETVDQTKEINNVKYAQFIPLSGNTFTSSDSTKILAGWNTQKNGNGMEFAANESVDKLTNIDGGTVHLYAMWDIPDVTITFDSHGGTDIASRYYTLKKGENVPYGNLSEPIRDGYTFMGWYTKENGQGRKVVTNETDPITETAYVSLSTTLHAYWQKKPDVTFNLQGGKIEDAEHYVKVCDYGQAIGTIPTPVKGNQAFMGWFTEAQGGHEINSSTRVTGDVIYYAHWGWQPSFETNGGSYTQYTDPDGNIHFNNPVYPVQSSSSYNLGTLPVVERENYRFDGWYIGDTDTQIYDNKTVDLSQNSVFKAHWSLNPITTITLNYNDGATQNKTIQVYKSQSEDDQNIIGELPTPTREGYRFDGWYDGNNKYTYQSRLDSNTPDELTLTAHWTQESHTVTFDPTDGEMVGSPTYTVADGKTLTYLPGANYTTQTGNTISIKKSFDGWYTDRNGGGTKLDSKTPITADATYYANWVDYLESGEYYNSMIRWGTLSGNDVTNLGDTLVFHPSASGNISAHLTVDITLENQNKQLGPEAVRITLPKKFFTGWDGTTDVTKTDPVFANFNVDTSADGEYFILTNATVFKSTVLEPVYTVDPMEVPGGYVDENGVCKGYFEKTFNVKVEIKEEGATDYATFQERNLKVELHTDVQTSVYKKQSGATLSWNDSWGEKPSDADEYFYVIWTLNANNYNSNQPYQLKWSENTVHDGSVVYSAPKLDEWSAVHNKDVNSNITVVTKHRRDEAMAQGKWATVNNEAILNVKWKSGYEQQFRTAGTATAYVGEIVTGSVRDFAKTVPSSSSQDTHYVYGGQDLILNSDAESLAPFVYRLFYTEKKNVDHPTWTDAGEMSVTPRTYVLSDGVKENGRYDVLLSSEKPTGAHERSSWNASTQEHLDDGDYYFTDLDINVTEYDAVYLNSDWSNPYENDNLDDYGYIKVYCRKMGSDDFELLKTIRHDEMGVSTDSDTEFTTGYEARIVLPDDTVGYKVEYTSSRYTTDIRVNTGLKLKNTRKLHSLVSTHANDGRHTLLKNKSEITISRSGAEDILVKSQDHAGADAWLSAYELTLSESELYAAKSCLNQKSNGSFFVTDAVASTVEFPVAITGWAYSKNQLGYIKRVRSGIFYDLLPHGFMVDRSKIIVCGRDDAHCNRLNKRINSKETTAFATSYSDKFDFPGKISSDYYSVTFKDNWEGSGQTMMIINVNCPEDMKATGFVVYYKCKTTINNLHVNGTTPKNYVAFTDTTAEQSVPEARINTRNYLDSATRPLFASVDNNQTAYAYATTTLEMPNVYQYGADSNVTTEGANIAKHQVVGLNTGYSYTISYEANSQTQDLIIYDVIERHIGGSESQWEGEFRSVDVSGIKNQLSDGGKDGKCAPVIYYSTKRKNEFTKEMFDLDKYEGTIWFNMNTTPPANMKDVTAIAVDCRKTDTGSDFLLGKMSAMELTINMMSPANEARSEIEAYNEAVILGFNNVIGKELPMSTLTSVTLRFTNPQFIKSAFPASGTQDKPESVVSGSVMDYILTVTNPDPEIPMANIVIEDKFPLALSPNNYYTVKFNDGATIPIDNTARVTYEVKIGRNDNNEDVNVFTATVDILNPGDTVEIKIPVKVGLEKGTPISNEAKITSINGVPYSNIASNKTYHTVTGVKAKILKVNAKDEPLAGATLEIYEKNDTNCDEQGKLKDGAVPLTLKNDLTDYGAFFTSTNEVSHFDIAPGEYILHESAVPENSGYKRAADIPFTVDVEGIIYVNGEPVNYVKMVDEPAYKVIFHENKPGGNADEIQKVFRIYEPLDLIGGKVEHFYDIPEWAGDEYVFAGWYHNNDFTECDTPDSAANIASNFENDGFVERNGGDYHLYAKWIKVGTVSKSAEDTNIISGYRGFGLAGVQIRDPQMYDENYTDETPGGLRFITSLSEELLRNIDALSSKPVSTPEGDVDVEYGYAVGTEANINRFIEHYSVTDTTTYTLQYQGENVNGKNTTGKDSGPDTDYRYISNVNCTKGIEKIAKDHRNFTAYRLYTLVVTYEGESASKKAEKIDARSYIRYYDANGKLRVFYNTYKKNTYYGGCMCSFNQVSSMALPSQKPETEENP